MIELVRPDEKFKPSVLAAVDELLAEGSSIDWYYKIDQNFGTYVDQLNKRKSIKTDQLVPETVMWAIKDQIFVGRISIRHELNDYLAKVGGHIGYEVRPSFRRQGIATEMLRLVLPIAKNIGLDRVLLTCDDNNFASIKTIEKNGGVLKQTIKVAEDKPEKRHYWIEL